MPCRDSDSKLATRHGTTFVPVRADVVSIPVSNCKFIAIMDLVSSRLSIAVGRANAKEGCKVFLTETNKARESAT